MKKRGSKLSLCQNLAMAPTYTHKQQNKKDKKEKKRGLPLCPKLAMELTYTHKQRNKMKKRKKMGAWAPLVLRVDDGAHLHAQATKHKEKKKKKSELNFLPRLIKLVLPNSPLLKLQALHFQALSSLNPNSQLVME